MQLALVRDTILTPRYLHTACPNPSRNTIEKQICGWYIKTSGASCVDSVFQGNLFLFNIYSSTVNYMRFLGAAKLLRMS